MAIKNLDQRSPGIHYIRSLLYFIFVYASLKPLIKHDYVFNLDLSISSEHYKFLPYCAYLGLGSFPFLIGRCNQQSEGYNEGNITYKFYVYNDSGFKSFLLFPSLREQ